MTVVDTIRAVATYAIAAIVVLGGGAIIYLSGNEPSASDTVAIVAGFVGSALTFVFGSEVQTRTARQAAASTYAAGVAAGNGHGPTIQRADNVTGPTVEHADRVER